MGLKAEKYSQIVVPNYYLTKKMNALGISSQYTAYYYLIDIMDILINGSKVVRSFSKEVYPKLASKYQKNECTIERDIRSVINVFWDKSLKTKLKPVWNREDRPSCCELIHVIKNYMCLDLI